MGRVSEPDRVGPVFLVWGGPLPFLANYSRYPSVTNRHGPPPMAFIPTSARSSARTLGWLHPHVMDSGGGPCSIIFSVTAGWVMIEMASTASGSRPGWDSSARLPLLARWD